MVVIRLSRHGARNKPFYHIVVTDSRRPRDSGYLERLGYFNPRATADETYIHVDKEKLNHWLARGVKLSDRVSTLVKQADMPRAAQAGKRKRPVKVADPKEAALDKAAAKALAAEQEARQAKEQFAVDAGPQADADKQPAAADEVSAEAETQAGQASKDAGEQAAQPHSSSAEQVESKAVVDRPAANVDGQPQPGAAAEDPANADVKEAPSESRSPEQSS